MMQKTACGRFFAAGILCRLKSDLRRQSDSYNRDNKGGYSDRKNGKLVLIKEMWRERQ